MLRAIEIGFGAGPTPGVATAKNSVGEIVQQRQIRWNGIRREAAIADHLGCNSLGGLFTPAFQHLEIRVTMRIDKARRDRETVALDDARIGGSGEGTDVGDG